MTIDELARRAGETTRNVRAYQTRGLLPAPRLTGRVGHYDERHLVRLTAIQRLRGGGFSLAAISALFTAQERGASLAEIIGPESPRDPADVFAGSDVPPALRLALLPEPVRHLAG